MAKRVDVLYNRSCARGGDGTRLGTRGGKRFLQGEVMVKQGQATLTWTEGLKFTAGAASGHSVGLDASIESGGDNAGFQPLDLLLVGLGGCTAMDVISILKKMRQEVTGYEVFVTGDRAEEHPKVFTHIHVEHVVRGRGIEGAALQRAIDLSVQRYCPAMAMLSKGVDITTSCRIVEEGKVEVSD